MYSNTEKTADRILSGADRLGCLPQCISEELLAAITVITRFSDLSFKYTQSMSINHLLDKKKNPVKEGLTSQWCYMQERLLVTESSRVFFLPRIIISARFNYSLSPNGKNTSMRVTHPWFVFSLIYLDCLFLKI